VDVRDADVQMLHRVFADVDAGTYLHFTRFMDGGKNTRTYKPLSQTYAVELHVNRPRLTSEVKYLPHIINSTAFQMFHDMRTRTDLHRHLKIRAGND